MAYDLKYQSDFYNIFSTLVSIKFYKRDYGVHDVINLRTTDVEIEVNYQDRYTPIIGTGARVVIVNEGDFDYLEDLLTSLEKEFLCTITYNGLLVFQGFSICDLNEQQFLPKARIVLQFTDYLRRIDGLYLECLKNISGRTTILEVLQETLTEINLDNALYVNSTLFEENMENGATDTFLEQTYFENNMIYSSSNEYDDAGGTINKLLKSVGAFIYSSGNKWIIERQEDISRDGNWVVFSDIELSSGTDTGTSTGSLKQSYNKQSDSDGRGDFDYVDTSQIVVYDSGLKTLILDLQTKQYGSLVFNDFSVNMDTVADQVPVAGSLDLRKWYIHENAIGLTTGYVFRGINTWLRWTYNPTDVNYADEGLYYNFEVYFNITEESPTILTISYKFSIEIDPVVVNTVTSRFFLIVDGGTASGYYIAPIQGPTGSYFINADNSPALNSEVFSVGGDPSGERTFTVSVSFNLSDVILIEQPSPFPPTYLPSIWETLGNPVSQKFMLMVYPPLVHLMGDPGPSIYTIVNYVGDFEVNITQEEILNRLKYHINEDFIKTETVDIEFFDLENVNFANGFLYTDDSAITEYHKTANWISENSTTAGPLMDIFAKNIFRNSYKTIHRLNGKILCDKYLKPFSIITDDNLYGDSTGGILQLILLKYTWNLNNGTYDIEAEEYTDEEITLDETEDSGVNITSPGNLVAVQPIVGEHMVVTWDAISGAEGYILQRRPYYATGVWVSGWKTIFIGSVLIYNDDIQDEAIPSEAQSIYYRICSYAGTTYSAYCDPVMEPWANT